jgi:hypothetical protein
MTMTATSASPARARLYRVLILKLLSPSDGTVAGAPPSTPSSPMHDAADATVARVYMYRCRQRPIPFPLS